MTNETNSPDPHGPVGDSPQLSVPINRPAIAPTTNSAPTEEKPRNLSLIRQLLVTGIIAALVVVGMLVAKAHSPSDKSEEANQGSALNPNQRLISEAAAQTVEIKTERVSVEPGATTIETNGTIHYSPYSTIKVSPKVTGVVRKVFVKVGDAVTAGQPLLTLTSSDAAAALDAARDADAQMELAASSLTAARKQYDLGTPEVTAARAALIQAKEASEYNRKMLQLAREQSGIGGSTDKPLTDAQSATRQAETQLAQDQKDLNLAQTQHDRTEKLVSIGITARQDLEAAENTLGKAKDAVTNDEEQVRIAHVTLDREQKAFSTRLYANQQVRQSETNYQQALLQEQAAATALRIAQAAILHDLKQAEHDNAAAIADDRSARAAVLVDGNPGADGTITVSSPASGVVTERDVNPGQIVDQSGSTPWQMMTIVDSKHVYVDAQLYEKDMLHVHAGDRATATSDAFPAGFKASGTVSYVAAGLDPTTHTVSVRADLDNSSGKLKDGVYVQVKLALGRAAGLAATPVVPLTAVVHDGENDYVFVADGKDKDGNAKYDRRQVILGEQRGEGRVAITKGLSGDETIVTHGALYLGPGATTDD